MDNNSSTESKPTMPARPQYNKGKIDTRLDAKSLAALEALIEKTGLKAGEIIRLAIIEKYERDVNQRKPKP